MSRKDRLPRLENHTGTAGGRKESKPAATRELWKEIREVAGVTRRVKRTSGTLARKSSVIRQAANSVYHSVESVRQSTASTQYKIQNLVKRTPGRKQRGKVSGDSSSPFPVVGIGASAGGFEAFVQLLENLSPNTGMAFVFVQHLDPKHESKLPSLLAQATQLPVAEIRNRTRLAPDRIYIIPSNTTLTVNRGILNLTPRKNHLHLPIDQFFQSLAVDQGHLAIGVILSGNGHDGTAGLREIKASGGITFAQDLKSAKYAGMPESAAASGCVDLILPPAGIARELERVACSSALQRARTTRAESTLPGADTDLARIFSLLRASTGVDFSCYKLTTLKRRIMRRMVLKKVENLGAYVEHLQQNPPEVELLFHDILINVTGFFRDPSAFQALKKKILPRIVRQKSENAPIRIWVPGCATGEEVYSLAICLHEFLGKNTHSLSIQLFGTDISENMVARARSGVYPRSIESEVSPERLRRYFQKTDNGYQIAKFIRDACIFAKQNVAEDPPFSKLDLISCRNLLIYLGLSLQKKVLPTFHYSLHPGGYLMLGTSETIGNFSNLFTLVDKRNKIYLRNETYSRPEIDFIPAALIDEEMPPRSQRPKTELSQFDLQKKAEEILLSQFCPPGVIVNARMDVLHFLGKTGPYLEPATGSASLNLLKMVRDELIVDLRTAITQAAKTHLPVRKESIRVKLNGALREVSLEIVPFKSSLPEHFFLVLFRDTTGALPDESKPGRGKSRATLRQQQAEREAHRLRAELAQTKESLQTIIEEQEATNEELKSANEEIQSSNEELQSTNEELETAKEELQSTNEELTTLNEELQTRNIDLSQANNDLNNLISSFNMPIVMLGNDLTIRRFTPLAQRIFNLIPSDVGRRISDINPNIPLPDLNALVTEVIDSLNVKEIEVQDREGHWYSLRIRPYRTSENKIDGAVMVLVDIGDIRRGLEELLEMVPQPMLMLTADLRVSKANQAFYEKFKTLKNETEGQPVFKLRNGQFSVHGLRRLLESVVPGSPEIEHLTFACDLPESGRQEFCVSARRLYQHSKGTHYVLLLFKEQA